MLGRHLIEVLPDFSGTVFINLLSLTAGSPNAMSFFRQEPIASSHLRNSAAG